MAGGSLAGVSLAGVSMAVEVIELIDLKIETFPPEWMKNEVFRTRDCDIL